MPVGIKFSKAVPRHPSFLSEQALPLALVVTIVFAFPLGGVGGVEKGVDVAGHAATTRRRARRLEALERVACTG